MPNKLKEKGGFYYTLSHTILFIRIIFFFIFLISILTFHVLDYIFNILT